MSTDSALLHRQIVCFLSLQGYVADPADDDRDIGYLWRSFRHPEHAASILVGNAKRRDAFVRVSDAFHVWAINDVASFKAFKTFYRASSAY